MKKVTIIGSGNAFHIDGRAHACYLLEDSSGLEFFMDFGATSLYRLKCMGLDPDRAEALLLTHFHGDHMGGLPYLILEYDLITKRSRPFYIIGPPGVEQASKRLLEASYPAYKPKTTIKYIEINASRDLLGLKIRPVPMNHRPESLGYRIMGSSGKTVAYSGDASYDMALADLTRGADLALIELSLLAQGEHPVAHVSLEELQSKNPPLDAARIVYTHTIDLLANEVKKLGTAEAAYDGMVIEL